MGVERSQQQIVVNALAPLCAQSVENIKGPGTPDVVLAGGWLENKDVDRWPRRGVLKDGVSAKKFTPQQRIFARRWRRCGGFHCVCLRVDKDWFLIEGVKAATHLGIDWTEEDIHREAWRKWSGRLNKEEFLTEIAKATERSRSWDPSK